MKYNYHINGTKPEDNPTTVFVFGSNQAGRHGAGAAKEAAIAYGAMYGFGEGRRGRSYAIPTKDYSIETRSLDEIEVSVLKFIAYAKNNLHLKFWVTAIGCGLAGYDHSDIAPMFADSPTNCNFPEEWKQFLG